MCRSASSPRGTVPLTDSQLEDSWNAGYETAAHLCPRHDLDSIDLDTLFAWAIRNDKRLPRLVNESSHQFWEWRLAFGEGVVDYVVAALTSLQSPERGGSYNVD